jgi:hypothetical protein
MKEAYKKFPDDADVAHMMQMTMKLQIHGILDIDGTTKTMDAINKRSMKEYWQKRHHRC